jgi:mevalonate kinase
MKTITVSSPGKLMLFGEHAVVYGKPCIVTSVNQRLSIKAQKNDEPVFVLNAPDVDIKNYSKLMTHLGEGEIPKGAKFVEHATKNFFDTVIPVKTGIQTEHTGSRTGSGMTDGVKFETVAQFKSTFGFGSSSASTVCTIKALAELFEVKLTEKEIFDLAYKTVLDVQGLGSGFDLAAAIYGGTLYFVTGGKTIQPFAISHLPLIVGYTGVKADTATIVKEVKTRFGNKPQELKEIYDGIEVIVEKAKTAFAKKDFKQLGSLMNDNQKYLEELGVSTNKLSSMINAARNAGAYGAKLSGAGGGDCMIALAPENKITAVKKAIENAGGKVLEVKVNTKGVSLENE